MNHAMPQRPIPACTTELWGIGPRDNDIRAYPAYTGEPRPLSVRPRISRSLPACTRNRYAIVYPRHLLGAIPRVRGNPLVDPMELTPVRFIPACTGEPHPHLPFRHTSMVYPRVYGGTPDSAGRRAVRTGLSPRVRGNLQTPSRGHREIGSIPACTGEPMKAKTNNPLSEVYPRVYGGTDCPVCAGQDNPGLSPRVRGNLGTTLLRFMLSGSIPACTGEPGPGRRCVRPPRVYPRVYGGTRPGSAGRARTGGLSPRVRGNPIPACTGEPAPTSRSYGA